MQINYKNYMEAIIFILNNFKENIEYIFSENCLSKINEARGKYGWGFQKQEDYKFFKKNNTLYYKYQNYNKDILIKDINNFDYLEFMMVTVIIMPAFLDINNFVDLETKKPIVINDLEENNNYIEDNISDFLEDLI